MERQIGKILSVTYKTQTANPIGYQWLEKLWCFHKVLSFLEIILGHNSVLQAKKR